MKKSASILRVCLHQRSIKLWLLNDHGIILFGLEIVRARKKCPKCVPRHFQNHVGRSRALECNMKSCDWALDQMLFQCISICVGSSHMIKIQQNNDCKISECLGLPMSSLPPKGGFRKIFQVIVEHDPFNVV